MAAQGKRTHQGRAWVFKEANINTDLLMPASTFGKPRREQAAAVLSTVRAGWAEQVRPGDIFVGGRNFGTGSSRPAALLLLELGISCLVAESFSDLFYRNSINAGLPALECHGISDAVEEGQEVTIHLETGQVVNRATGQELRGHPIPPHLFDILDAGGLEAQLKSKGYVT